MKVEITRRETGVKLSATSDEEGRFAFQLLTPGSYEIQAVKTAFALLQLDDINISVTETLRIKLHLRLQSVALLSLVRGGSLRVATQAILV